MGMLWSNRIGVPTATDPTGRTGPGYWWVTGSARPGLVPERSRRKLSRSKLIRRLRRSE